MMKTSSRDIVDGNWSTICRSRDSIDDFRKLVGNDYSIADLSEFTSAPAKAEAKGVFDSKAADVKVLRFARFSCFSSTCS